MFLSLCFMSAVLLMVVALQADQLRKIRRHLRENDQRTAKAIQTAEGAIRNAEQKAKAVREEAARSLSAIRQSYDEQQKHLVDRLIELANRPATILPAPDLAPIVKQIGEAVAQVAYGPERPLLTAEQATAMTYDLTRNLDTETLGEPSGTWMPDVEMDEWMEEHGVPNRPGWIAGAAPPTMPATPDTYLAEAPRPPGDTIRFASGQSGPAPIGGIE